jgi:DNA-binding NtrC family response regulator
MPTGTWRIPIGRKESEGIEVHIQASVSGRVHQVLASLQESIRSAVLVREVRERAEHLKGFWDVEASADASYGLFISSEMRALLQTAQHLARTDLPILILGETGTGKEVLATEIHAASKRAKQAFIPFNVTAVSRDLVESQLFGAKKGSFTGATHDTKGLLREAEGGTVFLDEIGEMSLDVQPKLLRFVEQGEIQPVGERPQHVDVRIIAATNASLQDLVRQGRFREDLFQRLRVVPLTIPPLRDRREEIPALTRHFIAKHAESAGRPVPDIAPRALERLVAADWPGNVRQLNNELKRVVALLPEGATIEVDHLSPELQRPPLPRPLAFDAPTGHVNVNLDRPLVHVMDDVERATIERVMMVCSGNQSEAARRLGITRKGLYLKLKRLGLVPD